jgi:OmcA/MtrC family decaheme c-type cytochrome
VISSHPSLPAFLRTLLGAALLVLSACEGDQGPPGPPGPPGTPGTNNRLAQGDDIPGLVVTIQSLTGGTASGGRFRVGDTPTVHYRLQKTDGTDWSIAELSIGKALLSGPTSNYQRVIAEQIDVVPQSTLQSDGSFTYKFSAIPATYLPPYFDSPAFGPEDGELTGQPLLDGTYTVGLTFGWNYTVDGRFEHDTGNATLDFVIGESGTVAPREVIKLDNCNRCHQRLLVHGETRQDVKLCVLCHTAGAEDSNLLGSTPGITIDFRVLIHRLHTGRHLPSVLGVATNPDGSRNYAATPQPYIVAGVDFSSVGFPAWPQGLVAMPRDQGYSALSQTNKAKEDEIRKGPSNCAVCHGDPDGNGPLTAPAQGDFYKTQPTRQACGSCHDDVEWGQNYTSNGQTMGAQANNSNCAFCHATSGNGLAVADAHTHPNQDPTLDPGLNLIVSNLVEAGTNNGNGKIDPGEKIRVRLRITDDADNDVAPASISAPSVVLSGPTSNYNLLLNTTIPTAALTGSSPFTVNLPMTVQLERLGVSTSVPPLQTFTTAFTPHLNVSGALTSVLVRTATAGGNSTLASATVAPQNYVDVASATNFARDDYVVVDDGTANEEYVRIQFVDGNRLWFSSPSSSSYKAGLERAHLAGATVREVTLVTKTSGTDYSLNAATGQITEVTEFGNGTVLASYTTDFVMPATYPLQINASPDLDDSTGKWTGKAIVDGTYTLGIWSSRSFTVTLFGESNSYKSTSDSSNVDFLVGGATSIEPYDLISSGSNCFNCHQELAFHGNGRRTFESCVLCHGTSGPEDRPRYVAANAPATTARTIGFRTMLHKIHMGENLANAATYDVVGFGSGTYPDNFSVANYAEVVFPALPGATQNCDKCHGNDAWHEPKARSHPTNQVLPVRKWTAVCGSCHDSSDVQAHIAVNTDSSGNESCAVCHAPDREENVQRVHKTY